MFPTPIGGHMPFVPAHLIKASQPRSIPGRKKRERTTSLSYPPSFDESPEARPRSASAYIVSTSPENGSPAGSNGFLHPAHLIHTNGLATSPNGYTEESMDDLELHYSKRANGSSHSSGGVSAFKKLVKGFLYGKSSSSSSSAVSHDDPATTKLQELQKSWSRHAREALEKKPKKSCLRRASLGFIPLYSDLPPSDDLSSSLTSSVPSDSPLRRKKTVSFSEGARDDDVSVDLLDVCSECDDLSLT